MGDKAMLERVIRLVTRGDDAGMNHTANLAIRDACERGILKNVSVMVPAPAFDEAAAVFQGVKGIDVGLHVDLTAEWAHERWGPVLSPVAVPTLVDDRGNFHQRTDDLIRNRAVLGEMVAEVRGQLAKARAAGLEIAYLDEHMGVGIVAALSEWLRDFCAHEGLVYNRGLLEAGALRRLAYDGAAPDLVASVTAALRTVGPGTYLIVGHPAYVTGEMKAAFLPGQEPGIEAARRDWQRRIFMDGAALEQYGFLGVEPIRYTDV